MRLVESADTDFLYHVTDGAVVHLILDEGIEPGYWGTLPVIRYYISMRLVNEPVVFRVPFSAFNPSYLEADLKGIQDPPSAEVTGMTEDEVSDAWDASGQSWQDSLKLIGSVRYGMHIAVTMKNLYLAK